MSMTQQAEGVLPALFISAFNSELVVCLLDITEYSV